MKTFCSALLIFFLGSSSLLAQENDTDQTSPAPIDTLAENIYESYARRSAININGGATGVGIGYAYNLNQHLNLKLRMNYFVVRDIEQSFEISGNDVILMASFENINVDLVLEYLPFKKSSFHLDAGLGYFIKYDPSALILYDGEIEYGEIVLDQTSIGDITVDLSWAGLSPFVGMGVGRAVPKKRIGLGMDFGVYYRGGGPQVEVVGTKMLKGNTSEGQVDFVKSFEQFQWIPYINLSLKVKL